MHHDDFICLRKDAIMPLLPLIGIPACLSPEGQDSNQPWFALGMLLSEPQQYLRRPQIGPQSHSGVETSRPVLDLCSDRFFQSV